MFREGHLLFPTSARPRRTCNLTPAAKEASLNTEEQQDRRKGRKEQRKRATASWRSGIDELILGRFSGGRRIQVSQMLSIAKGLRKAYFSLFLPVSRSSPLPTATAPTSTVAYRYTATSAASEPLRALTSLSSNLDRSSSKGFLPLHLALAKAARAAQHDEGRGKDFQAGARRGRRGGGRLQPERLDEVSKLDVCKYVRVLLSPPHTQELIRLLCSHLLPSSGCTLSITRPPSLSLHLSLSISRRFASLTAELSTPTRHLSRPPAPAGAARTATFLLFLPALPPSIHLVNSLTPRFAYAYAACGTSASSGGDGARWKSRAKRRERLRSVEREG